MEYFKVVKSRVARECSGAGAHYPGKHGASWLTIPAGTEHAVCLRQVTYGGALYSQGSRLCVECAGIVDRSARSRRAGGGGW